MIHRWNLVKSSLRMIERVYSHLTTDDTYDAVVAMIVKQNR